MNLLNNQIWKSKAQDYFKLNQTYSLVTNEKARQRIAKGIQEDKFVTVTYGAELDSSGLLCGVGFDLPDEFNLNESLFNFLINNQATETENSLRTKLFSFYSYNNEKGVFVFLVSKTKIYYLQYGVRAANDMLWESIENFDELINLIENYKQQIID